MKDPRNEIAGDESNFESNGGFSIGVKGLGLAFGL